MGKEKFARVIAMGVVITAVVTIATSTMPKSEDVVEVEVDRVVVESYGDKLNRIHEQKLAEQREQERIAEMQRLEAEAEAKRIAEEQEAKRLADIKKARELAEAKAVKESASASRGGAREITFELTFYTSLPSENGGYENLANGESIYTATNAIASNYYKLGTKIYLDGFGVMTVKDRGGSSFNSSTRLDVLVLRNAGESDAEYKKRVLHMGRRKVTGYVQN